MLVVIVMACKEKQVVLTAWVESKHDESRRAP